MLPPPRFCQEAPRYRGPVLEPTPASQLSLGGAEQDDARRALQGIDEVPDRPVALRVFKGPPDPDSLLAHLGYAFRPGQREAVEAALAGRDSLIVMPTGGGKSLCYQLPGLASEDLTIVVSPLIALMDDQWQRLTAAGHPVAMIASGMAEERSPRRRSTQVRGGEARIVYCSPERFGSTVFLDALAQRADRPARGRRGALRLRVGPRLPPRLPAPAADRRAARAADGDGLHGDGDRGGRGARSPPASGCASRCRSAPASTGPNLSFDVVALEGKGSKARKLGAARGRARRPGEPPGDRLLRHPQGHRRGRRGAARRRARGASPTTPAWSREERTAAQHRFMAGEAEVIVATNAFGMGVDKADVRSVWHMAIPTSVEAYYQEAGRAGRDGLPARAVLLAMRSDLGRLVRFIEQRSVDPDGDRRLRRPAARGRRLGRRPADRQPALRRRADSPGDR